MIETNRIIAVDDDRNVRLLVKRGLPPPKFDSVVFSSASEALESCRAQPPTLIISDYLMPGMSGEALLREVRASPQLSHVPFLFLTAVRLSPEAAKRLGAHDVLRKPFPVTELREKVERILTRVAGPQVEAGVVSQVDAPPEEAPGASATESQPANDVAASRAPHRSQYGRFSSVEHLGRRFQVLTEQADSAAFTMVSTITSAGAGVRRIATSLAHPLARNDDYGTVKAQIDFQHDSVITNLGLYVVSTRRNSVWENEARHVPAPPLLWLVRSVAQFVSSEVGEERARGLVRRSLARAVARDASLSALQAADGDPIAECTGDLPRATASALARWSIEQVREVLRVPPATAAAMVLRLSRERANELGPTGFLTALANVIEPDPDSEMQMQPLSSAD